MAQSSQQKVDAYQTWTWYVDEAQKYEVKYAEMYNVKYAEMYSV